MKYMNTQRLCVHLRAALHNDTTHSIHATVTHVHTLILDLDHPALEVLLVEQHDLQRDDTSTSYTTGIKHFTCPCSCFLDFKGNNINLKLSQLHRLLNILFKLFQE